MKINAIGHLVKTNPIQTQSKPIQSQLKPIKCQNKPNTNPIKPNLKILGGLKPTLVSCISGDIVNRSGKSPGQSAIRYGCSGSSRIQMFRNCIGLPWSWRLIGPLSGCGRYLAFFLCSVLPLISTLLCTTTPL